MTYISKQKQILNSVFSHSGFKEPHRWKFKEDKTHNKTENRKHMRISTTLTESGEITSCTIIHKRLPFYYYIIL